MQMLEGALLMPHSHSSGFDCTLRKRVKRKWKRGRSWPWRRCCRTSQKKNLRSTSTTSTPRRKVWLFFLCFPHDSLKISQIDEQSRLMEWVTAWQAETWLFTARSWFPTTAVLELWDDTRKPAEERGEVVQRLPGWPALQKPTWHSQPLWAQSWGKLHTWYTLKSFLTFSGVHTCFWPSLPSILIAVGLACSHWIIFVTLGPGFKSSDWQHLFCAKLAFVNLVEPRR